MRYEFSPEIQSEMKKVCLVLFPHIKIDRVFCFKSYGTSSSRTIARCHTLEKLMQKTLGIEATYVIEFLSENFDNLKEEERLKVLIHELMHIPKTFGGGFRQHNFVCSKNVNKFFKEYLIYEKNKDNF